MNLDLALRGVWSVHCVFIVTIPSSQKFLGRGFPKPKDKLVISMENYSIFSVHWKEI